MHFSFIQKVLSLSLSLLRVRVHTPIKAFEMSIDRTCAFAHARVGRLRDGILMKMC